METLQINPIRHFEIVKSGVKVQLSLEEIRDLAKAAGITANVSSVHRATRTSAPRPEQLKQPAQSSQKKGKKTWGISQEKKDRILAHVRKNLTSSPQSLSKLLEGATYAPNDLPKLREYIEQQSDVARMTAGKLTYYFKSASQQSPSRASPKPDSEEAQQQASNEGSNPAAIPASTPA